MLDVEKLIDGIHDYLGQQMRPFAEEIKKQKAEIAALRVQLSDLSLREGPAGPAGAVGPMGPQ